MASAVGTVLGSPEDPRHRGASRDMVRVGQSTDVVPVRVPRQGVDAVPIARMPRSRRRVRKTVRRGRAWF